MWKFEARQFRRQISPTQLEFQSCWTVLCFAVLFLVVCLTGELTSILRRYMNCVTWRVLQSAVSVLRHSEICVIEHTPPIA